MPVVGVKMSIFSAKYFFFSLNNDIESGSWFHLILELPVQLGQLLLKNLKQNLINF
jgi:hypothetical protein